jgi:ATP-dependent RNA helicase SUPV3L1/SUV3
MIEVWRPGRAEGRRRPQGRHRHAGKHDTRYATPDVSAPALAADAAASASPIELTVPGEQTADQPAPADAAKPERHSRHRRRQGGDQRFDRPRRERDRPPNHAARHERPERQERRQERYPDRREKAPDPNSPFAKLAALKAQLEAEAKERR